MSDLKLDSNGDVIPTELNWRALAERLHRPPVRHPILLSRQLYAALKGRQYPEPFRYLASWAEARRMTALPPVTGSWQEVFDALDVQRVQPQSSGTCNPLASGGPDW